jgi:formylglycine-generating enzyme required for sulfatase activity/class 3 adenylate cyclase/energy-coupling factor transporter ATP-binding protein EcfA2
MVTMLKRSRKKPAAKAERVVKTFLFSDLVRSTEIRNNIIQKWGMRQGNERFRKLVLRPHDRRIEKCIRACNGEVVSTSGDSYFIAFKDARQAVECAVELQRSLINHPILVPEASGDLPKHIQVRIGMHTGAGTRVRRARQANYDDETINIAHRIQEYAEGEQILTSRETWRQAGKIEGIRNHEWSGYSLKGVEGRWGLVEVLWNDRKPRSPRPLAGDSDHPLLQRYFREVWVASVNLKLTTIDRKTASGAREAAELDLAAIFTDLDVQESPDAEIELFGSELAQDRGLLQGERGRLPVMVAISHHKKLVLLGDPGSGKSTLLNFLSLCLAGEGLRDPDVSIQRLGEASQLPSLIPIRVLLRDYAARGLSQGKSLWQFFQTELAGIKTSDGNLSESLPIIERSLGRPGGALLLLDGVDEVPEANRGRVALKEAIETFARDFPHCRILVTSRPYGYQDPQARFSDFEVRTLMEFTAGQIRTFIGRWYAHLGDKDRALGRANAERYASQLQRVVETHQRMAELARRPLLLTLMASLHRWRQGGNLPERRYALYEESVQLLIDLWQREKTLFDQEGRPIGTKEYDVFTELGIRQDRLREALNLLAFEAHRDQPVLTGTHDITARQLAGALFEVSDDKGKAQGQPRIIRYITDRAGLLIERAQEKVYTFAHRTFQEYLAACHLAGPDFPWTVAEWLHQDDERWREVALLAAARAASGTPSSIWSLISVFCPHDWCESKPIVEGDWYLALRAGQALVETEHERKAPERQLYLIERLRTWLIQLLTQGALPPPERAEAGRLLNFLPGGDPRSEVTEFPSSIWVEVPAGACWIGSAAGGAYSDELPQSYVWFPAFRIMKYPITQAQFAEFVREKGYPAPGSEDFPEYSWRDRRPPRGRENHPVVLVSFADAVAFCNWLSGKLGLNVRLPTEGEWEYAAKGPQPEEERERMYPWGDLFDQEKSNTSEARIHGTSPVGMFPHGRRAGGAHDMSGNVWEWTASVYKDYPYRRDEDDWGRPHTDLKAIRAVRGGSWHLSQHPARCSSRIGYLPWRRYIYLGFRCWSPILKT